MSGSVKHHYVPQWYQRRFLAGGETRFHYLNLKPYRTEQGRRIEMRQIERWGVAKCFSVPHLYRTTIPGLPRDIFETNFFGDYDRTAAPAIEEVASKSSEVQITNESFGKLFEYLAIQSLRTLKGLALLRLSLRDEATQDEVLTALYRLRHIKCTMWMEGFQEVLHAPREGTGFIITDHPVTAYNRGCYPGAAECRYPHDPDPSWKGTQTIFPMDKRCCLVLTHSELAHKQDMQASLKRPRTNARLLGDVVGARTDQIIHRDLTDAEVVYVNQILKLRAGRYLASPVEDWLFPERHCARVQWPELGRPLLPTTHLWRNTGPVYIGLADGGVVTRDEFGRGPRTPEEQAQAEGQAERLQQMVEKALRNSRNRRR